MVHLSYERRRHEIATRSRNFRLSSKRKTTNPGAMGGSKSHLFNHRLKGLLGTCTEHPHVSQENPWVFGVLQISPLTPPLPGSKVSQWKAQHKQLQSNNKALASLDTHWPFPPFPWKTTMKQRNHCNVIVESMPFKKHVPFGLQVVWPLRSAQYFPLWWTQSLEVGHVLDKFAIREDLDYDHEHYLNFGYVSVPMLPFSDMA